MVVEVDDDKGEEEVMYMTRSSRRQMKFCYLQSKHNLFIHLMLGSNIVFKSEATRWLSKWWISRRMADKVTKLTISLFLLFQCCEYFGPNHFPSEVFATCTCHLKALRVFFIIRLPQLHFINFQRWNVSMPSFLPAV